MDQDRRDAAAWAKEWQIKQRNRKILSIIGFSLLIAAIGFIVNLAIVHTLRTTFRSAEDMRKAMQGRYAIERNYMDMIIEGDDITLTYLSFSHYDRSYAEQNGYDYSGEDSVYEDSVVEWDYRNGLIKTRWMGDIIVDKDGNIRRKEDSPAYWTFRKTDKPRPEPIDPSTLNTPAGDTDIPAEEEEMLVEREESIESTEDAAEDAGVLGTNDSES